MDTLSSHASLQPTGVAAGTRTTTRRRVWTATQEARKSSRKLPCSPVCYQQQQDSPSRSAVTVASNTGRSKSPRISHTHAQSPLLEPKALTAVIKAATTPERLVAVCQQHAKVMNYIHASAAITHLAKLCTNQQSDIAIVKTQPDDNANYTGRSKPVIPKQHDCSYISIAAMCSIVGTHIPEFEPRAVANSLWATAKLIQAIQTTSNTDASQIPAPSEQQIPLIPVNSHASSIDPLEDLPTALQALQQLATQLIDAIPDATRGFQPQHFSNTLYALSLLQTGTSNSTNQDMSGHSMSPETGNRQLDTGYDIEQLRVMADIVIQQSLPVMHSMTTQGASNMLYAAAVLQLQPSPEWMDAALDCLEKHADQADPQHVANSIWALAKLGYFPGDDWLEVMLTASPMLPGGLTTQSLAMTMWGSGVFKPQLGYQTWADIASAVRSLASQFGPQDVSNVLWALAVLKRSGVCDNMEQQEVHAATSTAASNSFSTQRRSNNDSISISDGSISNSSNDGTASNTGLHRTASMPSVMLWDTMATAVLQASYQTATTHGNSTRHPLLCQMSAQHIANTIWAVSVLQLQIPVRWQRLFWKASYSLLSEMKPEELASTLLALGRLQMKPPLVWWTRMERCVMSLMGSMTAQQLVGISWAMSTLGFIPQHPCWLLLFKRQVVHHVRQGSISFKTISSILWSLAKLSLNPGLPWTCSVLMATLTSTQHAESTTVDAGDSTPTDTTASTLNDGSIFKGMEFKDLAVSLWAVATIYKTERSHQQQHASLQQDPPHENLQQQYQQQQMLQQGLVTLQQQQQHSQQQDMNNSSSRLGQRLFNYDIQLNSKETLTDTHVQQTHTSRSSTSELSDVGDDSSCILATLEVLLPSVQCKLKDHLQAKHDMAIHHDIHLSGSVGAVNGDSYASEMARYVALVAWSVGQLSPLLNGHDVESVGLKGRSNSEAGKTSVVWHDLDSDEEETETASGAMPVSTVHEQIQTYRTARQQLSRLQSVSTDVMHLTSGVAGMYMSHFSSLMLAQLVTGWKLSGYEVSLELFELLVRQHHANAMRERKGNAHAVVSKWIMQRGL